MYLENPLINTSIKILLTLGIPFIWWYKTARKKAYFLSWVGLKKVEKNQYFVVSIILAVIFLLLRSTLYVLVYPEASISPESVDRIGFLMILYAFLVHPIFLTGLLEEVGFRGFLGKRLIGKFGFVIGNIMQAAAFGILHNIFGLYLTFGLTTAIGVFILNGGFGWIAGYITEKQAGGSVVPAWILHSIANMPIAGITFFVSSNTNRIT